MNITFGRAALMTAFVALIAPVWTPAVHATPLLQADRTAQQPAPAVGQLTKVDPDAKTLSIKTASGSEMLFSYDDQTVVTGGQKSVAGLATMSGAQLTVSYKTEGTKYIATRIEVRDKA